MTVFHHNQLLLAILRLGLGKIRDCHGVGLIEFFRKGFVCRRLTQLEPNNLEIVWSKLTIFQQKMELLQFL